MNFTTKVNPPNYSFNLSHQDKIVSFGSCFSENIGQKLQAHKFEVLINPFGILFNPISISSAINQCIEQKLYEESDLSSKDQIYFSFNHHSSYSGIDKTEVLKAINSRIKETHSFLLQANTLIVTVGTAWCYRLKKTSKIVANCYKLPSNLFSKELLTISEITTDFQETINSLLAINPALKIVFTVSPVRHWKDGVVENQQSKSTLLLAISELIKNNPCCHYFPSYEIMIDELRDYRFYAEDMLHPSPMAIEYIYEKFGNSLFDLSTQKLNKHISQINQSLGHRPTNSNSDNHKKFVDSVIQKIEALEKEFPFLDFSTEKSGF